MSSKLSPSVSLIICRMAHRSPGRRSTPAERRRLGAQALLRHVVGAVRAALDLDGHDRLPVAVERFVADEHGDIRSHGVSHHVGDLQGAPVASSTPSTVPSSPTPT